MNWLQRFMMGRYGGDQLGIALLILSMISNLVASQTGYVFFAFIGYLLLVWCLYRMLSRDIYKRSMENYKFTMLMNPIYNKLKKIGYRLKDAKTHRYFKCPQCKTTLRVPKGKGKIIITCPKCRWEFTART